MTACFQGSIDQCLGSFLELLILPQQVLDQIMVVNLKDSMQSWELHADGAWKPIASARPSMGNGLYASIF